MKTGIFRIKKVRLLDYDPSVLKVVYGVSTWCKGYLKFMADHGVAFQAERRSWHLNKKSL